ncbi:nicotinamide-nucleotide adenylyltransferase, NadR type [Novosphingobium sp. CF614]|uniref:AAA family ATPase n=1 Tax=Novosphingobium sp. CF614 TaxID=1884364 RepID=UPI0008EED0D8|nr:ATP-binding protein [Novosphingobium sp. CF614]SFF74413.1 nicotinamide-nucleotide adenylyltransferase, NadR type [Novosphingobium sp. CF614]
MMTVCLHGAESTGKSTLARKLGHAWVPEYGRTYCERNGTELRRGDLLAIAEGQAAANRAAMAMRPPLLVLDTDQLMTAAWAMMLFGEVPQVLMEYPKADLYLLFAPDVPWRPDGTRFFGEPAQRARFAALAEEMLVRAEVPFRRIAGSWDEREAQARAAISRLAVPLRPCAR